MGNVNELMTELADAVRLKSGVSGEMTIKQMVIAMAGITVADDIGFTCGTASLSLVFLIYKFVSRCVNIRFGAY